MQVYNPFENELLPVTKAVTLYRRVDGVQKSQRVNK